MLPSPPVVWPENEMELKALEQCLNGDTGLAKRFLADPVATLEAEGFALNDSTKESLRRLVSKTSPEAAAVPGSSLAPTAGGSAEMVSH